MLRSFRVANHKSIRDEQELLLVPAYDKTRAAVPVAGIYGANAAGKSNLLDALRWMQYAVRSSYAEWEPGARVPRTPFRLDPAAAGEPSLYSAELVLDGVRHAYGFVVDDDRVREEWLHSYPLRKKRVVFERHGDEWAFGLDSGKSSQMLREITRDNALFLSVAARSSHKASLPVYRWFQQGLSSYEPGRGALAADAIERITHALRDGNSLIDLIRVADLGIEDVIVADESDNPASGQQLALAISVADDAAREVEQARNAFTHSTNATERTELERRLRDADMGFAQSQRNAIMTLRDIINAMPAFGSTTAGLIFLHGSRRIPLTSSEQSAGTRSWVDLVVAVLAVLDSASVFLVDELDTSLHSRLVARLVELFRDQRTNPHGAQLIFTTHDATLLGTSLGREVLQRDQIWFVEKDKAGATKLFPLTDFRPRKEENTERRYLGGSYGAVPAVFSDTLVNELIAAREEPASAAS
jgi:hypothetical protein